MKRLTAALLSFAWTAFFAAAAWSFMLVAEDGIAATSARLGLPAAPEAVVALATRPAMAGLCLGASVVASLFATVLVTAILNGERNVGQGKFIADMGFGGGFGLAGLAAANLLAQSAFAPALAVVLAGGVLLASFFAMRAVMADAETAAERPMPARWLALDAAAHINVVRFPVERAAGVRP
jgi:hypothetical protein